jgi:hypothetical protein
MKLTGDKLKKAQKIARQNRRRAKQTQYQLCKVLGAKNVGGLGGEDGEHKYFSYEIKDREKYTTHNMMLQAIANNGNPKKIPAVAVHVTGGRRDDDLITVRLVDWLHMCECVDWEMLQQREVVLESKKKRRRL